MRWTMWPVDEAGHDRAVCQADVVQAGEVELDDVCGAGLPLCVSSIGW